MARSMLAEAGSEGEKEGGGGGREKGWFEEMHNNLKSAIFRAKFRK